MHSFINDGDPRIHLPNIFIFFCGLSIFSFIRFPCLLMRSGDFSTQGDATRRRLVNNHRSSTNSLMRENFNPLFHWRVFCTEVRWNSKLSNTDPTSRAVRNCWYNKDHRIMSFADQREIFISQLSDHFLYAYVTSKKVLVICLRKHRQPILLLK